MAINILDKYPSYAVGNAVDELKKHATGIIMSNEEDGVAHWLEDNF